MNDLERRIKMEQKKIDFYTFISDNGGKSIDLGRANRKVKEAKENVEILSFALECYELVREIKVGLVSAEKIDKALSDGKKLIEG